MREIKATDLPDYDAWGPDTAWTGDEWIAWHKAMVPVFGGTMADQRWVAAWRAGVSRAGGGTGTAPGAGWVFDSVPVAERTLNTPFREYVAARRALYEAVYSGVGGGVAAPLGGAADALRGGSRVVSNAARAATEIPGWAWLLLGGAALGVIAVFYAPRPRR